MSQQTHRVVIAEDDVDLRHLLAIYLRQAGVEVVETGDGRAALTALRAQTPSLLCLDLNLPVVNGFEVLRRVRRDAALETLTVVVITGRDNLQDMASVKELGVVDFVSKPFNLRELTAKILGLLGQA